MTSLAGQLLVASRHLTDPNFARSVVLMLEHGEEGALGVIINRLTDKTVSNVWDAIGETHVDCEQPVNTGGPVPGPLIALHDCEELGEKQVMPGVYMSVQKEVLDQIVLTANGEFRIYSGHSGWGGGQLEEELEAGGWVTGAPKPSDVYDEESLDGDGDTIWRQVLNRIGLSIMLPGTSIDEQRGDPRLN